MWHSFASMTMKIPASNSNHSSVLLTNRLLCRRQTVDLVWWLMCLHSVCAHSLFSARDFQWYWSLWRCRSLANPNMMMHSSHFRRLLRVEHAISLPNYLADWVCNRFRPALLHRDPTKNWFEAHLVRQFYEFLKQIVYEMEHLDTRFATLDENKSQQQKHWKSPRPNWSARWQCIHPQRLCTMERTEIVEQVFVAWSVPQYLYALVAVSPNYEVHLCATVSFLIRPRLIIIHKKWRKLAQNIKW